MSRTKDSRTEAEKITAARELVAAMLVDAKDPAKMAVQIDAGAQLAIISEKAGRNRPDHIAEYVRILDALDHLTEASCTR